ncbi:MAG: hypothetical protein P8183_21995, partial [Anaerolineae bacterium]
MDSSQTPTPVPPPVELITPVIPPTPGSVPLPLDPDTIPGNLPIYTMTLDPIPDTGDAALAWAQSFGLANAAIMDETEEMIRILSRDGAAGSYEELTFLRTPYDQAIVYSSGIDWQSFNGPTPTPAEGMLRTLPPETVTAVALDFVRGHHLLPEPIVAHEFPAYGDQYLVHVAPALG